MGQGALLADAGAVVTFGITPDAPETGYGYIQAGHAYGDGAACEIARFVEKPDLATAQERIWMPVLISGTAGFS